MSDDIKTLPHTLMRPGQRIVVSKELASSTYPAGTLGYSSIISPVGSSEYKLFCKQIVYIIRRGKSGKSRLEATAFMQPIYFFNNADFKKHVPKNKYNVLFKPSNDKLQKLLSLSGLEFTAWACAYISYLKNLNDTLDFRAKIWPTKKTHLLNIYLMSATLHYRMDPDVWLENNSSFMQKVRLIEDIRRMEALLYRSSLKYYTVINKIKMSSIQSLLTMFTNDHKFCTKKLLSDTAKSIAQTV